MDLRKLGKLPKPKPMATVPAGLLRGVATQVDRRRHRVTPVVVADYNWTRYWRNTPLLSSPRARITPSLTATPNHHRSVNTERHTAGYLSSSWPARSTVSVTNINSPTSTTDVKKLSKETSKSTTDTVVLEDTTSDVTGPGDINTGSSNVTTTTTSKKFVLPLSRSTTSNSSASVTVLTSQHHATSDTTDSNVSGVDVKAQAAEAGKASQANSNSQTTTGEMMMMTYLTDEAGMLPGSISDLTQVQQGETTPLSEAIQVTNDRGETMSDEIQMLSGSSNEALQYRGTTLALNDVRQVSINTRETSKSINNDLMLVVTANDRWKNATSESVTVVDEDSTSEQSAVGRVTNTRAGATTSTFAAKTSAPVLNSSQTGRGRSLTSAKREQEMLSTVRSSSLTEGPIPTISSTDGSFSLWPRPVLYKSVNSTDNESTGYWSNQCTLL